LFQPFTQGDSSISRKYGGSGLGLTISQRLVQIMGGEIRVESQPGLGSLFTFALTLPYQDVRLEQNHKLLIVNAGELNGKRVLVVEDNQINQMVAMDTLKNMGMQVTLANSGEEALEVVKQQQFDAVLMDIQMPGMDGYQTTAQIRLNPCMSQSQLPIIAMTAHALQGDRQKALEAGLNDYISKPVDVAQLASVLLRWVKPRLEKALEASQSATHPEAPGSNQSCSGTGAGDDLPVTLDSINMEGALTRLGGNRKLYRRLLQMFQDEHANKIQTIQEALKNDDIELARLLVHSLKGVAGTIGADELIAATKQLELSIADGKSIINDQRLALVELKLAAVLTSLETLNRASVNA
jgi:CheY-like chemotaxis protein